MSDLETRPREQVCRSTAGRGEQLLITARRVPLGKTTEVARALPDRQIRMIGPGASLITTAPRSSAHRLA